MLLSRRTVFQTGLGAMAMGLTGRAARADEPIRIGFLTVKTGPLAAGGIQMEQGMLVWLKLNGNKMGGRPVELIVADTAGAPATTRTKTQELVERDKVHLIIGPLAAFEAIAVSDYLEAQKMPTLGLAAADETTQRNNLNYFARATSSAGQLAHPMAHYAVTEMKMKRICIIADDFAYGHEQLAGFARVFEDDGGKVVQRLLPPLNAPDYGTYISQIKNNVDGVYMAFAGSNGFRFTKAFFEYGLGGKLPLLGGMTAMDEAILQQTGEDAVGIITTSWYSAAYDNAANKAFVAQMNADYKVDPGYYAAGPAVTASVLDAALKTIGGKVEDREGLVKAIRTNEVDGTVRGPVRFDKYGQAVGNAYIRRVENKGGKNVNTVIKTYPNVSQFWTYNEKEFLAQPVYSRDFPALKNLEN
jgi:branched-chain amino acid transport system substrate-binding protein